MIVDGKDGEPLEEPIKIVLTKLCSLYGLWSLEKHLTTLYQGKPIKIVLTKLCLFYGLLSLENYLTTLISRQAYQNCSYKTVFTL